MARVKLGNIDPRSIPVVRGSFYLTDNASGPVARAWPPKRPPTKKPIQRYHQWEFTVIATYAANPYDVDYGTAVEMVKGTEYVPRDFLMKCAYGSAYEFPMPDGSPFKSFRMTVPNPQPILDLVTQDIGALLKRTNIGWEGLLPGNLGWVLTMDDDGPKWLPSQGGGSSGSLKIVTPQLVQTSNSQNMVINTMSGKEVTLAPGQTITGLAVYARFASPTTVLTPALYDNVNNQPTNRIALGQPVTGVTVGWNLLNFDAPFTAPAFDTYYPGVQCLVAPYSQAVTNLSLPGWTIGSVGIPAPILAAPGRTFANTNCHCFPVNL